ncbi:Enoyl-CoA hydratase/carnithine racemase [Legionella rubrilucens]|uniref:3-hydroxyisobutyryl-CoA hydrolase n=1 Tax=Legionella rubrilucens TaxID=458 RepID=A0A0W0XRW8_9GAMM|nr:enoyl-CoA hydratase/isomerase family protein [Legionella rubrilucens]KTD47371.1 Enoyl-CoA hydratase/carnithine racemase [Legionella rubrilucens]
MTVDILFSRQRHLGLITLNRPEALNALTLAMIKAMQHQLLQWQKDTSIHAIVIQAAPGKAFCAGGDVRWLYEAGKRKDPEQMQFFWHEYRLNHFIHHLNKPCIALMDGITMGGGVGVSLHGSHPVASERFVFAMPETGIGFFPDIGASYLLARCPGQLGIYLGLTGNRLNAEEALTMQLVKQQVTSEQFPALLNALVEADLSKDAYRGVDDCLSRFAARRSNAEIENHLAEIDHCFRYPHVEAILDSLREVDSEWTKNLASRLLEKAPLSLKITLEQIHKAKSLSMAECIKMDYCLVSHFMKDHDFYEGVRALLVDKDKAPKWQPDCLERVTSARVADYFECENALELINE